MASTSPFATAGGVCLVDTGPHCSYANTRTTNGMAVWLGHDAHSIRPRIRHSPCWRYQSVRQVCFVITDCVLCGIH